MSNATPSHLNDKREHIIRFEQDYCILLSTFSNLQSRFCMVAFEVLQNKVKELAMNVCNEHGMPVPDWVHGDNT